jgi:spore coat polysaccharide biosynthesis protein SpsF (cytidylyltransferase family)
VHYRVVPGLTFTMCMSGELNDDVKKEFLNAIDYLLEQGVCGITGDCGFMMWF